MCKKIFKILVYSVLIVLSISAISIVFLLPKDDFKECECEELDSSLTEFLESKFEANLIDTLYKTMRSLKKDKYNQIIIFKPTTLEHSQYEAYTEEVKEHFSIEGMGITDEYSFIKYNMELSYNDLLNFDFHRGYFMTNVIMAVLKSVAYKEKSNALYFESKQVNFLINGNHNKKFPLAYDANIYYKNGKTASIMLFDAKESISLNEFKKIVCSQIKLQDPTGEKQAQ